MLIILKQYNKWSLNVLKHVCDLFYFLDDARDILLHNLPLLFHLITSACYYLPPFIQALHLQFNLSPVSNVAHHFLSERTALTFNKNVGFWKVVREVLYLLAHKVAQLRAVVRLVHEGVVVHLKVL